MSMVDFKDIVASTKKGKISMNFIAMWNLPSICQGDLCPIYETCPHKDGDRCNTELIILSRIFDNIVECFTENPSDELVNQISCLVMPLYQILIKLYMTMYSVEEMFYFTNTGKQEIHPVYTEIRKTIRDINSSMKSLGMGGIFIRDMGLLPVSRGGSSSSSEIPLVHGDGSYYDRLSK